MSLVMKEEIHGSTLCVKVIGLMDYSTVENFMVEIPDDMTEIIIDFSGLDFIDSTGIGSILSIIHAAADRGIAVTFEGLNKETHDLFETVGVYRIKEALLKGGQ
ncbi:STAS domain-containing protein [Brevibacillus sp. GCM10020057]|uniref:STAS domain-containing protein n=1 Tax=Brevibacillus sp. GCM10020057 TaxID=3317327 RepID=UPI003634100A